jgi:type IV secretion system protein VirB3
MSELPEGFVLPLHRSLTRPILIGGSPRGFAILNGTLGAAVAFGLQQPLIGFPLFMALHGCAAWAAARDPWFLETWPRHLAKPLYLEA